MKSLISPGAHQKQHSGLLLVALFCAFLSGFCIPNCKADSQIKGKLDSLLAPLAYEIGVSVVDLGTQKIVYARNDSSPLKPASVLKVVTSAVALQELGPGFTFKTDMFALPRAGNKVEKLYIRGGGDPNLTLEEAWLIARQVKLRGIQEVETLALDASLFGTAQVRSGARAFEAGSSALSFNFNSVSFQICPGAPGAAAQVIADPWESGVQVLNRTKTTKGVGAEVDISEQSNSSGNLQTFAVSGEVGHGKQCFRPYRSVEKPLEYFARSFLGFLRQFGIKVPNTFREEVVPESASLIYSHASKPLSLIVQGLNHFSNNFIAEQVLYALGRSEEKWSREGGLERMRAYLQNLEYAAPEFLLSDASGLSHANRISARILTSVLRSGQAEKTYGVEFLSAFAVDDQSGTLERRDLAGKDTIVRGKTGTLDGVSSLAGIMFTGDGHRLAFAILQNGTPTKEKAVAIEDRIIEIVAAGGAS